MKITKKQLVQEIRKIVKEQNGISVNNPAYVKAKRMLKNVQNFADENGVSLSVDLENGTYVAYIPNVGWVDSRTAEDIAAEESLYWEPGE